MLESVPEVRGGRKLAMAGFGPSSSLALSTPSQFRSRQLTGPNFLIWEGKLWKDGLKTLSIYSVGVHTCNPRTLEDGPELLSEAFSNKPATMQNPEPKVF